MFELTERTQMIFREMMTHPAIFTHESPQKIAILGDADNQILQEVLKHPEIKEVYHNNVSTRVDILINAETHAKNKNYSELLHPNGIFIQKSHSPFEIPSIQKMMEDLKTMGFLEFQIITFPQPAIDTGLGTAIMAMKQGVFRRLREKNVFNKPFKTHYYNFDVHHASLALPEFMRKTFTNEEEIS